VPLTINGWTLLFHEMMINQVRTLADAYNRARTTDPHGYKSNSNVRVLASIAKIVLSNIPDDPSRLEYRLGNTMGKDYRHWSRCKFGGRFRLFFRYDTSARIIVFAWVNDENTLRARDSRNDPYTVFKAMLARGNPPDDWKSLLAAAGNLPEDVAKILRAAST
jgi:toxin YhaV